MSPKNCIRIISGGFCSKAFSNPPYMYVCIYIYVFFSSFGGLFGIYIYTHIIYNIILCIYIYKFICMYLFVFFFSFWWAVWGVSRCHEKQEETRRNEGKIVAIIHYETGDYLRFWPSLRPPNEVTEIHIYIYIFIYLFIYLFIYFVFFFWLGGPRFSKNGPVRGPPKSWFGAHTCFALWR